jgi:hypothetical protein
MKIIKSIAALFAISALLAYHHFSHVKGIELNELWFIVMSGTTAIFGFISMSKKDSVFVSSLVLLCSLFYTFIPMIFIYRWCIQGEGSTNYYIAIYISAVLTFLYLLWDVCKRYKF